MPADLLIEWTKGEQDPQASGAAVSDVAVFTDGRVRFGPRLGGGNVTWRKLPADELEELRRFLFDEQAITGIESEALVRAVEAAAQRRQSAMRDQAVDLSIAPQMDAGTTVLRAVDAGRTHEVRYYDLFGDAARYPEIEALQRLRAIELRLLDIAERHAASKP